MKLKLNLITAVILCISQHALATDYYTASSNTVLNGNTALSNYLTTNPDGVTGLGDYVFNATDNLIFVGSAAIHVNANTIVNNIIVNTAFCTITSSYNSTLIVENQIQLAGKLGFYNSLGGTFTLQLGNGATGAGTITNYNGAVFDANLVCLDLKAAAMFTIIKGGSGAASFIFPKNCLYNNTISNLEINLANIASVVSAAYNSTDNYLRISGQLTLTRGRIVSTLPSSTFYASFALMPTATTIGGKGNSNTDYSYLWGSVTVFTNSTDTRKIPVGGSYNLDRYRPAYITPQTSAAGEYYVQYYEDAAEESSICNTARLSRYSVKDFWDIKKTVASPPVKIAITYYNNVGNAYWKISIPPTSTHLIILAHKVGCWQDEGGNTLPYNSTSGILSTGGYLSTLSPFTVAYGPAATLPLQLVSFTGQHSEAANLLQWQTASEINVSHFEIQRSADGANFNPAGIVQAKNIDGASYNFSDGDAGGAVLYYRLKMIDDDGSFTYSKIIKLQGFQHNKLLQIWPNPVENNTIRIKSNAGEIQFFNSNGIRVFAKTIMNGVTDISVSHLAAGMYIMKWKGVDGKMDVERFIKK